MSCYQQAPLPAVVRRDRWAFAELPTPIYPAPREQPITAARSRVSFAVVSWGRNCGDSIHTLFVHLAGDASVPQIFMASRPGKAVYNHAQHGFLMETPMRDAGAKLVFRQPSVLCRDRDERNEFYIDKLVKVI
jgi:hypothetical protein